MSTPKFTPGPWRLRKRCAGKGESDPAEDLWYVVAGQQTLHEHHTGDWIEDEIHVVDYASDRDYGYPEGAISSEANAHFIAAAPELYAAVNELLEWCIWDTDYAARARAAIAKAEGRQP